MSAYKYALTPKFTVSDNPCEVFCARFSPDGKLVAAGCVDGAVRVFNGSSGKLMYTLNETDPKNALPTTSVRFRPLGSASKTKNVLLAVSATGAVQHWHITSGKCLHTIDDENNPLFCVDYRNDGAMFATAGKDYKVRIYDEATKTVISTLSGGLGKISPGHSNRVFSLRFNDEDPNTIVSGGWDNTVQIWDVRTENAVRSFYGPHICGDAVDLKDGKILTGSYRPDKQLQLWDFNTGKLIETIDWQKKTAVRATNCSLYAAQFSKFKGDAFIGAGGHGSNEAKIFDCRNDNKCVGTITGLSRAVFTFDFSPVSSRFCIAGGDSTIRVYDIERKEILAESEMTTSIVTDVSKTKATPTAKNVVETAAQNASVKENITNNK